MRHYRAEVPARCVFAHHVTQEHPHDSCRLGIRFARTTDRHGVSREVGQAQRPHQRTAIGVGIGAHPPVAGRCPRRWRWTYDRGVFISPTEVDVIRADGKVIYFLPNGSGGWKGRIMHA
jgi:hypothetical protein